MTFVPRTTPRPDTTEEMAAEDAYHRRAQELYDEQRRYPQPSWVNAGWIEREKYYAMVDAERAADNPGLLADDGNFDD